MQFLGKGKEIVFCITFVNERILHIERDETIAEITARIRETKTDELVIVIPRCADIFSSIVYFQVLRTVAEEESKNLSLVTLDSDGRNMIRQVGIPVFTSLEDREKTPFEQMENHSETKKIRKIFIEKVSPLEKVLPPEEPLTWSTFFSRPSLHALFFLLIISTILFLLIATIAIPEARIFINPVKREKEALVNITFLMSSKYSEAELRKWGNAVFSFPIEEVFVHEMDWGKVSKDFRGSVATGKMTVYNKSFEERIFKPGTRFQTESGIIFRTKDWVRIPPQVGEKIGEITISVESDIYDAFGSFSGERGNLTKNQKFFLPGLAEASQKNVWGENKEVMTGGKTVWVSKITQKDIDLAKKEIEKEMKERALEKLQRFLETKNINEGLDLTFLPNAEQVSMEVLEINVDPTLVEKEQESFHISGKVRVRNLAYSQSDVMGILKARFMRDVSDGMEFDKIDENNFVPEILSVKDSGGLIKASVSVKGVEKYLIEAKSMDGLEFVNRVKQNILGMSLSEAELYLNNLEEVETSKIVLWPFWANSIPKLPENIVFLIEEESPS